MDDETADRYADYRAAVKIEQAVHSVTIGYRLTLSGAPPIEVASWHQDPTLERHCLLVRAGGDELTLTVAEWRTRPEEIRPFLREWISERVHLEQTKLRSRSRRPDPYWINAWRRAHPWT